MFLQYEIFIYICTRISEEMLLQAPIRGDFAKIGAIAQLVEQRTENPCVPGSIPGGTTSRKADFRVNY